MYDLEVIYIYCILMVKMLQKCYSVLLCITSQFWVQGHHIEMNHGGVIYAAKIGKS